MSTTRWVIQSAVLVLLVFSLGQARAQGRNVLASSRVPAIQTTPYSGRTITFSGLRWNVKSGCNMGPGPNCWSDALESVWTDAHGLHLKIRQVGDRWHSAEVSTFACATYGMHCFQIVGRPDWYDKNVVLGLFLYKDDLHELDVEFAKWSVDDPPTNAQYVVQPYTKGGNRENFVLDLDGTHSTHTIDWRPDEVRFRSLLGHDCEPSEPDQVIHEWTYQGDDIPSDKGCVRVHINLWLFEGNPPSDAEEAEITIRSVQCSTSPVTTQFLPVVLATTPGSR